MNVTDDRKRRRTTPFLLTYGVIMGTLCVLPTRAAPPPGYTLSWSDEFHQGVGAAPDPAVWGYDTGGGGWGNGEMETYVNDREHTHIVADPAAEDGQALQILATDTHGYESARMTSAGKHSFQYGFIEARIKMPFGQGIWPAFWMLGSDIGQVGWPGSGEIDIMENIGMKSWWGHNLSSLHSAGADDPHENFTRNAPYDLPEGRTLHDGYHLYQMLWAKDSISFYIDGSLYETRTAAEYGKNPWPFNAPFFFLLNTAVGGGWPGKPDATTQFPQRMLVDYIRVYQGKPTAPTPPSRLTAKPADGRQILLTWPADVNVTSYTLYRSTMRGGADGTPIKTGIAGTTYLDNGLTPSVKYFYRVAAVNGVGISNPSREASATAPSAIEMPYHGKPAPIPGTLQIEDFDKGGEGLGYHDSDDTNSGGVYRPHEGVDIETNSTGFDVGWTATGEWLRYSVDVASAGTYTAAFRVTALGKGGSFHLEDAQGHNLTGPITVTDTGGWQNWAAVKATLTLPAGRQVLKLVEDTGGYNLDAVTFTR
jgi:beta-glucanase (GH16 family)